MGLFNSICRGLRIRHVLYYVASLLSFIVYLGDAQDACSKDINSIVVVKQTIHIVTSIPYDTTFEVNKNLTVTVNNAPTELDLITTFYSQSTILSSANRYSFLSVNVWLILNHLDSQITMGRTSYAEGTFALVIMNSEMSSRRRRQSGSFMGYNGRATSSCTQASVLSLSGGALSITYANGTVAQFSATSGDAYDYLIPSTTPGNITTTFSLSNTGNLLWTNSAFFNGGALFCVLPSGIIVAVFQQGTQPTSCVFIDLTIAEREWHVLLIRPFSILI